MGTNGKDRRSFYIFDFSLEGLGFSLKIYMSWLSNLTGSKSQQPPPPSDAQEKAKEKRDAAEVLQKAREVRNSGSYQAFDPEGLERAAKAIKELNQSR